MGRSQAAVPPSPGHQVPRQPGLAGRRSCYLGVGLLSLPLQEPELLLLLREEVP